MDIPMNPSAKLGVRKLCTILARGGSKGVPNKNTRILAGLPLIAHTIRQAQDSKIFDAIAVSSDSEEILNVAKEYQVTYLIQRPAELASDTAPKLPAIQHCVVMAEAKQGSPFDIICDLDPTSPFRKIEDIVQCLRLIERPEVSNVITGAPSRKSPYFNLVETDVEGFAKLSKTLPNPIARRQDSPKCYDMNASIYVWRRDTLLGSQSVFQEKTFLYPMAPESSIEIDTEMDFKIAQFFSEKLK